MKRCPNCDRTFDDAMRFCQTDGTPLVEAAEPVDPYKTMVARPEDIAAAIPRQSEPKAEEEVLDIPPDDPKKTIYASEAEIRSAMAEVDKGGDQVIDIPPIAEPEPPRFIEPTLGSGPPPPFAQQNEPQAPTAFPEEDSGPKTTPPIPSPFDGSMVNFQKPSAPDLHPEPLNPPPFAEPERPAAEPSFGSPFAAADKPSSPIAQADPTPAAQGTNWQDNQMQTPQFQGSAGAAQNKTLAIVSLVVGILGLTICCGGIVPNIVAIVLGFMARGKAKSNPSEYGGAGLATGGIVTGVLGLLLSLLVLIFFVFFNGMAIMMREMPR